MFSATFATTDFLVFADRDLTLDSPALVEVVRWDAVESIGPHAAATDYRGGDIESVLLPLTPAEVNEYIRHVTGDSFTAKDFRTRRATIVAAQELAAHGPIVVEGGRAGADGTGADRSANAPPPNAAPCVPALPPGNSEAVARGSYIDPRVFEGFREGRTLALPVSPETAIRRLLLD